MADTITCSLEFGRDHIRAGLVKAGRGRELDVSHRVVIEFENRGAGVRCRGNRWCRERAAIGIEVTDGACWTWKSRSMDGNVDADVHEEAGIPRVNELRAASGELPPVAQLTSSDSSQHIPSLCICQQERPILLYEEY